MAANGHGDVLTRALDACVKGDTGPLPELFTNASQLVIQRLHLQLADTSEKRLLEYDSGAIAPPETTKELPARAPVNVDDATYRYRTNDGSLQGGPDPTGALGWGFGVGVVRRKTHIAESPGTYSWTGGMGTSWANDPVEGLVGILLTNQLFSGPWLPPIHHDFWTSAYTALA